MISILSVAPHITRQPSQRRLQLVQTGHIHLETQCHNICNIQDTLPLTQSPSSVSGLQSAESSLAFMPYTKFPPTNQFGINQRLQPKSIGKGWNFR